VEVIVEDKQLSLAIGKKGQNVRLAAKLTGWKIDIKSEEEKRREVEAQFETLELPGDNAADTPAEGEEAAGDTGEALEASNGAGDADAGEQVAAQAADAGEPADEVDAADAAPEAAEESAAETTRAER
jgi:N utilization substance protein A